MSFKSGKDRSGSVLDLGVEPPILAQPRAMEIERRSISLRWLSGVVLTLVSGSALIGSAIYAALDRETTFAEAPAPAAPVKRESPGGLTVNPKKSDRLVRSVDIVAAKQTFRTPTTVRVGNREVVRARAFTKIATPLTLTSTGFAEDVPRFNPLKLLANNGPSVAAPDLAAEPETAQDDAEVSFTTRNLADLEDSRGEVTLSLAEVQAQVTEFIANSLASGSRPNLPLPPQLLLMRTSRAGLDPTGGLAYARPDSPISTPFTSIEVRMVPENVTLIPKAQSEQDITTMQERLAVVKRGEVLTDILKANGATPDQIKAIVAAFGMKRNETPVKEGQKIKLLLADLDGSGKALQIARISVYTDETLETIVAITDAGQYIQVEKAQPATARNTSEDEDEDSGALRLYESLFETALKQEVPRPIIDDLIRIFGNDVDFQRPVAGGDSFEAFYEENEENENRNELLYAAITARGETFRYYRFQSGEDNLLDYYDEKGRSARKFLIRQPVQGVRMTSGFGRRFHPIMRYSKMHTGVDFAGPKGTPIFAAGNGTVIKAGWDSGYGRRVEIQHPNGYVTTYSHQSAIARGIREGVRVRQGQVIGYIGSTGLSTGAHLHYEVIVNGNFVDPMRIRLSRTRELEGKVLAEFRQERERIDNLMSKAPNAAASAARPAATAAAASATAR